MEVYVVHHGWLLVLCISVMIFLMSIFLLMRYRKYPVISARLPVYTSIALFILLLFAGISLPLGRALNTYPCSLVIWQDHVIIHIVPSLFFIKICILAFQFKLMQERISFYKRNDRILKDIEVSASASSHNLSTRGNLSSSSWLRLCLCCEASVDDTYFHRNQHFISKRNVNIATFLLTVPPSVFPAILSIQAWNSWRTFDQVTSAAGACQTQGWEEASVAYLGIEVILLLLFLIKSRDSFDKYKAGMELRNAAMLVLIVYCVFISAYLTNNFLLSTTFALTSLITEIGALVLSYYMGLKPVFPLLFFDLPCVKGRRHSFGLEETTQSKTETKDALLMSAHPEQEEIIEFLLSPLKFMALEYFMMQEFSVESLFFVLECWRFEEQVKQYKLMLEAGHAGAKTREVVLVGKAHQILESYIVEGAMLQVSLDDQHRKRLDIAFEKYKLGFCTAEEFLTGEFFKSMSSSSSIPLNQVRTRIVTVFQPCFDEVLHRISTENFRRFKNSQEYEQVTSSAANVFRIIRGRSDRELRASKDSG